LNYKQIPEFVAVGHVCQDILPDGGLGIGGSVSYASTTAHRLGYHVGIVTSAGPGLDVAQAFPGMDVACHRSAATTVFENIYLEDGRKQILHKRADSITCGQVPTDWRRSRMVYLGSIDQEIDPGVFSCFAPDVLVGVMPQGFFRRWDEKGHISFTEWTPPKEILQNINVLVISELDVPDPYGLVHDWGQFVDVIVITHAERGATVYHAGEPCRYPARTALETDPTGAGDVFTAAFMIRYAETGDPCQAAPFANAVASFSVEAPGITGIPLRPQVEAYLEAASEQFLHPPSGSTQPCQDR
jgi:sugar/nucleoside kinase (ribokinase family)